ncbi:hypothetical protein LRA02_10490 [Lentilactobacillus rapi]|uniref:Uncharacterized protein n=1 Tax=Lentilactobacillus rapi TaxID=481723 RepID=A0A512PLW2_9LACO|nr:hypothetical protein LRA02_10490 [Lentilactobacillus rapi]
MGWEKATLKIIDVFANEAKVMLIYNNNVSGNNARLTGISYNGFRGILWFVFL